LNSNRWKGRGFSAPSNSAHAHAQRGRGAGPEQRHRENDRQERSGQAEPSHLEAERFASDTEDREKPKQRQGCQSRRGSTHAAAWRRERRAMDEQQ
jgi:hypothetical protein